MKTSELVRDDAFFLFRKDVFVLSFVISLYKSFALRQTFIQISIRSSYIETQPRQCPDIYALVSLEFLCQIQ